MSRVKARNRSNGTSGARRSRAGVRLASRQPRPKALVFPMLENVHRTPFWKPTRPWADWKAERGARLHRFINEQVYPYSPHYRRLFDANGIDPRSIRSVDDLRRIPFTAKKDIAPTADNPTRHLDLVLQPDLEKLRRYAPKSKQIGRAHV